MKRFLFLAAAVVAAAPMFAESNVELPEKGTLSTEVQINPFDQDGNTFKLDGIKLRYFITDKDALRAKVGFGLTSNSTKDDIVGTDPYSPTEKMSVQHKQKSGDFSFDLGYERHFFTSGRIDLYGGAQVGVSRHFASASIVEGSEKLDYTNCIPSDFSVDASNLSKLSDRGYLGWNLDIFTGIDFYLYKGLFVGTELGLSMQNQKLSKAKYEYVSGEASSSQITKGETTDKTKSFDARFQIEPTLRIGWTF